MNKFILLLIALFLLSSCSKEVGGGFGSETSSGMIALELTIPDSANSDLTISVQSDDYNPIYPTSSQFTLESTPESSITFETSIESEASLFILDSADEFGLWQPEITLSKDTATLQDTLKKTGTLVVSIPATLDISNSALYFPGTGQFRLGSQAIQNSENLELTFQLPPGVYKSLTHTSTINQTLIDTLEEIITIISGQKEQLQIEASDWMETATGTGFYSINAKFATSPSKTPAVTSNLIPASYNPVLQNSKTYSLTGVQEETKTFNNLPFATYNSIVIDSMNNLASFLQVDISSSTTVFKEDTLRETVALTVLIPKEKSYTHLFFQGTPYAAEVSTAASYDDASSVLTMSSLPQYMALPLMAIDENGKVFEISDTIEIIGKTADTISVK